MKYMLAAIPASIAAEYLRWGAGPVFLLACIAIIPLAAVLGDATEQVAFYTGPKIGGMLNATMGNVPEFLIGFFAVKAGLFSLVKASIIGSVMGNTALVLGFSALVGGIYYKQQEFNTNISKINFSLLVYGLCGMILPAVIVNTHPRLGADKLHALTIAVAVMLIAVYLSGIYFSLFTHKEIFDTHKEEEGTAKWSLWKAVGVLAVATFFVAVESEMLVGSVEEVVREYGLPETFIGIIIIPIVGNVAEHAAAIIMAAKDKLDISLEIAVGSGTQIALFVGPLLALISFVIGNPMPFVFSTFELACLSLAVGLGAYTCLDGKMNWLEGVMLIGAYVIIAIGFFFV